jgi:disulfide bond formation protein DsbB
MQKKVDIDARQSPRLTQSLVNIVRPNLIYLAWFQSVIATLGSLFFSEVMHLVPCLLCWYQRIAMYPLVLILTVGILLRDRHLKYYVLPLSIIGLGISTYHNLLYYGIIPESIAPCTAGISCTTRQIEWLGFITIPLMALTAFIVIIISMLFYKQEEGSYDTSEDA